MKPASLFADRSFSRCWNTAREVTYPQSTRQLAKLNRIIVVFLRDRVNKGIVTDSNQRAVSPIEQLDLHLPGRDADLVVVERIKHIPE